MQTGRTSDSTPKKTVAKPRARTKGTAKKETLHLKSHQIADAPHSDMTAMIATAAYYCAQQRHFEPGHELEDWLTAEQQIKALYG
jgi:hypothetical protein